MGEIEEIIQRLENVDVAEGIKQVKRRRRAIKLAGVGAFASCLANLGANLDRVPENFFPFIEQISHFNFYISYTFLSAVVGLLTSGALEGMGFSCFKMRDIFGHVNLSVQQVNMLQEKEKRALSSLRFADLNMNPIIKKEVLIGYYLNHGQGDKSIRAIKDLSGILHDFDFKQHWLDAVSRRIWIHSRLLLSHLPFFEKLKERYIPHQITLAINHLASYNPRNAVRRLDKVLRRNPNLVGLQFLKGYILEQFGYPVVASSEFTKFFSEFIPEHAEDFRPLRETKQEVGIFDIEYLSRFCVAKRSDELDLVQQAQVMEIFSDLFGNSKKVARCFGSFDMHQLTEHLPEGEREKTLTSLKRRFYTLFSYVGDSNLAELVDRNLDIEALNLVSELHNRSITNLDDIWDTGKALGLAPTEFRKEFNHKVLERINDSSLRKIIGYNLLPFFGYLDGNEGRVLTHRDYMRFNVVLDDLTREISMIDALGGISFPEEDLARYCMDENSDRTTRNDLIEHSFANLGADKKRMLACAVFALSRFVGSNVKYGLENEINRSRVLTHAQSFFELAEDFGRELSDRERDSLRYAGDAVYELAA